MAKFYLEQQKNIVKEAYSENMSISLWLNSTENTAIQCSFIKKSYVLQRLQT